MTEHDLEEHAGELWLELARQVAREVRCDVDLTDLPLLVEVAPNVRITSKVDRKKEKRWG